VNRAGREVVVTRAERERAGGDVLRRNLVRQVNNLNVRIDAENDAFDGGDEVIGGAEIGEQRDQLSVVSCQWSVVSGALRSARSQLTTDN